jgi:hypothetical protein
VGYETGPRDAATKVAGLIAVKISLNDSIPEDRRLQVAELVTSLVDAGEIEWRASRFPRFVILVEPGPAGSPAPDSRSIFESPRAESNSLASLIATLEDRIKACLATPASQP